MFKIKENGIPIFEQIVDYFIEQIISKSILEGQFLPSIRSLAVTIQVNPLTIAKAYQKLENAGWIEKVRGQNFKVKEGVSLILTNQMREKFLNEEWPLIFKKIKQLGLDLDFLNSKL